MTDIAIVKPDQARDAHFMVITHDGSRGQLVQMTTDEVIQLRDYLDTYVNGLWAERELAA